MTIHKNKCILTVSFAGIVFLIMAFGVKTNPNWFLKFDQFLQQIIQQHNTFTNEFFISMTNVGSVSAVMLVSAGTSVYLIYKHHYRELLFLLFNIIISTGVITQVIKHLIKRPRPQPQLILESGYSFPSGHSMATILLYGSLIVLISYHFNPSILKKVSLVILMSFIVIVPISRVFVNVHYPSDVIAGISLGYVLLTLSRFFFLDLHLFFKRSSS